MFGKARYSNFLKSQDGSHFNQYLFTFTIAFCFMSAGQHYGWTMPYLSRILAGEFDISLDEDEASYVAMIGSVGDVVGAYVASCLIDRIGRKYSVLSISIPQILGFVLTYFGAENKSFLYCARISGGIGEGAILAIGPTYLSEIALPELRGMLNILLGIFFPFGAVCINIIGSYLDIEMTAMIALASPFLFLLTFSFMPESPYFLLMKNQIDAAEHSLQILRRSTDVQSELKSLTKDVARQMSETGTYRDLFLIPTNRLALLSVIALRGFQQYTGYTAVTTYLQVLLKSSTNFSPLWGATMLLIIQIFMNIVSFFTIDKLGRRFLLITSSIMTCSVLFLLSTFFLLRDYTSVNTYLVEWFPLFLLVFYVIGFMSGYGTVVGVVISEIFSTSIKSKALGLNGGFFAVFMMTSIKLYQYLTDYVGMTACFYVFTSFSFFAILFIYFVIPETKGKTLEEIQQDLMKRSKKRKSILDLES